jgi:hypothetical protein
MSEFTDELPMIDEPSDMCGSAALTSQNMAETLVSNVCRHSSSLTSSTVSCVIW